MKDCNGCGILIIFYNFINKIFQYKSFLRIIFIKQKNCDFFKQVYGVSWFVFVVMGKNLWIFIIVSYNVNVIILVYLY